MHTDRGDLNAPLVVDGLARAGARALGGGCARIGYQPPDAPLSRGLEVHPDGNGDDLEIWIDRSYVPAGYAWSFPAAEELRIGVGSFDPRFHVKDNTVKLARDLDSEAVRYQGNWIPHKLRDATEDGVFFVGDSAGHCLPLTAEGIRTAFYFGIACGRELRAVVEGRRTQDEALAALPRLLRLARVEVQLDAPHPARGAAGAAAAAPPDAAVHAVEALRGLVVPALPEHRAAAVNRSRRRAPRCRARP